MNGKAPDDIRTPLRVVVSGIGAVSAAGWGIDALRAALRSGSTAIGPFDAIDHARQRTHVAGAVPPAPRMPHVAGWGRLARCDRFAIFAAFEALGQSGLATPLAGPAGVFFGSSTGGLLETERYYQRLVKPDGRARRGWLASHHLSAPAESIARTVGATGPVETTSSACASGTMAIAQARDAVAAGEVAVAIAGGADCLATITYTGFNSLRAVDEMPCRPFRVSRAGLSLGEGAGVLVLERENAVLARGGTPLMVVHGGGSSCDAGHMTAPQAEGIWAANAIVAALTQSRLDASSVDYVNAHGTGTPLNDAAEHATLQRVFGQRAADLPIEATKSVLGHLLGAAGAVEAVAVALALGERVLHPAPTTEGEEILHVDLVRGEPRHVPALDTAVSLSLGFGGANAALVLGRWHP